MNPAYLRRIHSSHPGRHGSPAVPTRRRRPDVERLDQSGPAELGYCVSADVAITGSGPIRPTPS